MWGRKHSDGFLAIACAQGKLSRYQAREIFDLARILSDVTGTGALMCGELACELRYMTAEAVKQVLAAQGDARSASSPTGYEDPVPAEPSGWRLEPIVALALTAIALFVAMNAGPNPWAAALAVLGAGLTGVKLLQLIWPGSATQRVSVRSLRAAGIVVTLVGAVVVGMHVTGWVGLTAWIATVGAIAATMVLASWRSKELVYSKVRALLTLRLDGEIAQLLPHAGEEAIARKVLTHFAQILTLNLWETTITFMAQKTPFVPNPTRAISLWYLEPSSTDATRFDIRWFAAPEAPSRVAELYSILRREHHPRLLNQARYDSALEGDTFKTDRKRNEYVSLAGFVHRFQRSACNNAGSCLVFDNSYRDIIGRRIRELPKDEVSWLDFWAVFACPIVVQKNGKLEGRGVLIGLKNKPYQWVKEDMIEVLAAARRLEILFADSDREVRNKS